MWNNKNNKLFSIMPKTMKKLFCIATKLQTHYHFKLDFQNVDQHKKGKWLIHGTIPRKDNPLQSLEFLCRISH